MSRWSPLAFQTATDARSGALIYRAAGALTASHESFALLESVREALGANSRAIVLNLAGVDAITSAGVGVLASCHGAAVQHGASLSLVALTPRTRTLLNVVRLLTLIPEFETEEAALASLNVRT